MTDDLMQPGSISVEDTPAARATNPEQPGFSAIGNVSSRYRHHDVSVTAGASLILPGAFLKWYEMRQGEEPIPYHVVTDGRSILTQEVSDGSVRFDHGLGIVVLHYSPPLT